MSEDPKPFEFEGLAIETARQAIIAWAHTITGVLFADDERVTIFYADGTGEDIHSAQLVQAFTKQWEKAGKG